MRERNEPRARTMRNILYYGVFVWEKSGTLSTQKLGAAFFALGTFLPKGGVLGCKLSKALLSQERHYFIKLKQKVYKLVE